jgi:DNA modification methylase
MERYRNRLLIGDAKQELASFPNSAIRLCVTSPPYNVDADYGSEFDDRRSISEWRDMMEAIFQEVYDVLKPDGRLCLVVGASYGSTDSDDRYERVSLQRHSHEILDEIGFSLSDEIVWTKNRYTTQDDSALLGSYPYPPNLPITQQHEYVLVFRKPSPQDAEPDRPAPRSERHEASKLLHEEWKSWTQSVWEIPPEDADTHEAVFPVALARRLVKLYSFVGDIVIDPFIGSGTTAVAAKQVNRAYVGIDQNGEYVAHARERVEGEALDADDVPAEAEPPDEIPQYILDGLDRQDPESLRAIAGYARQLATEREQVSLDDITTALGENESIEGIHRTDTGAIVEKRVPCGRSCDGCPHGPYKYRVYRDNGNIKMDYLGPVEQ